MKTWKVKQVLTFCFILINSATAAAVNLPPRVESDIQNITRDIYNPRDFSHSSPDSLRQMVRESLQRLESEPESWQKEIVASLLLTVMSTINNPKRADSLMASALRNRVWEIDGPSLWDNFRSAAGEVFQSFASASALQVKKALKIFDKILSFKTHITGEYDSSLAQPGSPPVQPKKPSEQEDAKSSIQEGNVSVTGASASANASALELQVNVGNVSVTGASASANASASIFQTNVGNVSVTGASAQVSANLSAQKTNVANFSVRGPSASASVDVHGAEVNVGNVSVSGPSIRASVEVGPSFDFFNVSVRPGSVNAGVRLGAVSMGNISLGGINLALDLNPLNWVTNLGIGLGLPGGGGGSGGDKGGKGSGGQEKGENTGDGSGTEGNPPSSGGGQEVGGGTQGNGQGEGAGGTYANIDGQGTGGLGTGAGPIRGKGSGGQGKGGNTGDGSGTRGNPPSSGGGQEVGGGAQGNGQGEGAGGTYANVDDQGTGGLGTGAGPIQGKGFGGNGQGKGHIASSAPIVANDPEEKALNDLEELASKLEEDPNPLSSSGGDQFRTAESGLRRGLALRISIQSGINQYHGLAIRAGTFIRIFNVNEVYFSRAFRERRMTEALFFAGLEALLNPGLDSADRLAIIGAYFNPPNLDSFDPNNLDVVGGLVPLNQFDPILNSLIQTQGILEEDDLGQGSGYSTQAPQELIETINLVNQLLATQGGIQNLSSGDIQEIVRGAIGPESASAQNEESSESQELCDFCKRQGHPCCMKCLLNRGPKKVVNHWGNVHGFAP